MGNLVVACALLIIPMIIGLAVHTYNLFKADGFEISHARDVSGGIKGVLFGEVDTNRNTTRDHYVHAGLAYNKRTLEIIPKGTLSDESVDLILK